MAGASVSIDIDDEEVVAVLRQLQEKTEDLSEAFADIGEYLLDSHKDRFDQQTAPDGTPWAPLSPAYKKRKKKNADQILLLEGHLKTTLRYQASATDLLLGTNRIQGATHQFGDDERGIPARPFLGLSDDDRDEVVAILGEFLLDPKV